MHWKLIQNTPVEAASTLDEGAAKIPYSINSASFHSITISVTSLALCPADLVGLLLDRLRAQRSNYCSGKRIVYAQMSAPCQKTVAYADRYTVIGSFPLHIAVSVETSSILQVPTPPSDNDPAGSITLTASFTDFRFLTAHDSGYQVNYPSTQPIAAGLPYRSSNLPCQRRDGPSNTYLRHTVPNPRVHGRVRQGNRPHRTRVYDHLSLL